jgi:hypothetical protein
LIIASNNGNLTGRNKRIPSAQLKTVSHNQGRPDSETILPIYRKGFPGKKSLKAEVFIINQTYHKYFFEVPILRQHLPTSDLISLTRLKPTKQIDWESWHCLHLFRILLLVIYLSTNLSIESSSPKENIIDQLWLLNYLDI